MGKKQKRNFGRQKKNKQKGQVMKKQNANVATSVSRRAGRQPSSAAAVTSVSESARGQSGATITPAPSTSHAERDQSRTMETGTSGSQNAPDVLNLNPELPGPSSVPDIDRSGSPVRVCSPPGAHLSEPSIGKVTARMSDVSGSSTRVMQMEQLKRMRERMRPNCSSLETRQPLVEAVPQKSSYSSEASDRSLELEPEEPEFEPVRQPPSTPPRNSCALNTEWSRHTVTPPNENDSLGATIEIINVESGETYDASEYYDSLSSTLSQMSSRMVAKKLTGSRRRSYVASQNIPEQDSEEDQDSPTRRRGDMMAGVRRILTEEEPTSSVQGSGTQNTSVEKSPVRSITARKSVTGSRIVFTTDQASTEDQDSEILSSSDKESPEPARKSTTGFHTEEQSSSSEQGNETSNSGEKKMPVRPKVFKKSTAGVKKILDEQSSSEEQGNGTPSRSKKKLLVRPKLSKESTAGARRDSKEKSSSEEQGNGTSNTSDKESPVPARKSTSGLHIKKQVSSSEQSNGTSGNSYKESPVRPKLLRKSTAGDKIDFKKQPSSEEQGNRTSSGSDKESQGCPKVARKSTSRKNQKSSDSSGEKPKPFLKIISRTSEMRNHSPPPEEVSETEDVPQQIEFTRPFLKPRRSPRKTARKFPENMETDSPTKPDELLEASEPPQPSRVPVMKSTSGRGYFLVALKDGVIKKRVPAAPMPPPPKKSFKRAKMSLPPMSESSTYSEVDQSSLRKPESRKRPSTNEDTPEEIAKKKSLGGQYLINFGASTSSAGSHFKEPKEGSSPPLRPDLEHQNESSEDED